MHIAARCRKQVDPFVEDVDQDWHRVNITRWRDNNPRVVAACIQVNIYRHIGCVIRPLKLGRGEAAEASRVEFVQAGYLYVFWTHLHAGSSSHVHVLGPFGTAF
jgi:hypothetical protein